jgi:hypothetical protein
VPELKAPCSNLFSIESRWLRRAEAQTFRGVLIGIASRLTKGKAAVPVSTHFATLAGVMHHPESGMSASGRTIGLVWQLRAVEPQSAPESVSSGCELWRSQDRLTMSIQPMRHSALLRDIRSTSAACRAVHPQG